MKKLLPVLLTALMLTFPGSGQAQDNDSIIDNLSADMIRSAEDVTLEEFLWIKRPLVVFADSPADPRYVQQMQFLTRDLNALDFRDVVIITDTDPAARSSVRTALRPRGFMLTIIDKDGGVKQRKPLPPGACAKSAMSSTRCRPASRKSKTTPTVCRGDGETNPARKDRSW